MSISNDFSDLVIVPDFINDRLSNFNFIGWWDRQKVQAATVLVIGIGALGNEVLKNLAMMGIGHLIIVDFDRIEMSNLSRSILFSEDNNGQTKVAAAANAISRINPSVRVKTIFGSVEDHVGFGVFRHVDAVIGCVDTRQARLHINQSCWRVGRPWIDGAIQDLLGIARVWWGGHGACYECGMIDSDYKQINARYSCSLVAHSAYMEGKVATTPTIASIIGGMQSQEALKIIHQIDVQSGRAFVFNGMTNDVYFTNYVENTNCLSHESFEPIIECVELGATSTIQDTLSRIRQEMGVAAVLELDYDFITNFECLDGSSIPILKRASDLNETDIARLGCNGEGWLVRCSVISGDEWFANRTLADIGIPPLHILIGRHENQWAYFELTGDRSWLNSFDT